MSTHDLDAPEDPLSETLFTVEGGQEAASWSRTRSPPSSPRGDRYTACVVMQTEEAVPKLVDVAFAGRGDAVAIARTVGDCHVWTVREPQVDCAEPHDFEYLGEVAELDGEWEAAGETAAGHCEDLLRAAASETAEDGVTLGVVASTTGPSAWAQGDRRAACFAVADQAGLPVRIAGSVAGEWEPAGVPGDGLTA